MPEDVLGLEVELELYCGGKDYKARDEIADVDREMLDNFMSKDNLGAILWTTRIYAIDGRRICELLFGEKLSRDTVSCYMITLSRHCTSTGYEICFISTIVQVEFYSKYFPVKLGIVLPTSFEAVKCQHQDSTVDCGAYVLFGQSVMLGALNGCGNMQRVALWMWFEHALRAHC
ncbi:hypothetical protein ABFX02_14G132200 [Erythranthe guttata]